MSTQHSSSHRSDVSRRAILVGGGGAAGLLTLSLTSCGGDDNGDSTDGPDASNGNGDRPLEAPMLTELVEAGDLPPLEERMPVEADRLVVETDELGVYGGDYRGVAPEQGEGQIQAMIGFEPLLRPDRDLIEDGLPGALKDVTFNEEGTEYTLHLREGLRWSDGEPVTADDIIFAIEDVYYNTDLYAVAPEILRVGEEQCTAERVDDYTVVLTYPSSKGNFIDLATRQPQGDNFF